MSDQTTTDTTTTTYTNSDGDPFAALGVVSVRTVDNSTVEIPDAVRKVIAAEVTFFSGKPNTTKRELQFPSADAADKYRAQLKSYAKEHNLNCYLPTEDKFGRKLNVGPLVTYRLATHTVRNAASAVTVTNASDLKIPSPAKPTAPKPTAPKPAK